MGLHTTCIRPKVVKSPRTENNNNNKLIAIVVYITLN